jgi:hypothetical protein
MRRVAGAGCPGPRDGDGYMATVPAGILAADQALPRAQLYRPGLVGQSVQRRKIAAVAPLRA